MTPPVPTPAAPGSHYENFPVASWLCPPRLRPPIAAIYWFARTADDIADEGDAPAAMRLGDLAAYRADLAACAAGLQCSERWPHVFVPLAAALREFDLPAGLLADLLSAFEQDVCKTRDRAGYRDRADLLDYCAWSANPVGRLLLHLYGVSEPRALEQSDAVCSALQLINFWQDISVDVPRGRYYLPAGALRRHGLDVDRPETWAHHPARATLLANEVRWARETMLAGAPMVHRVAGRAGWELRLVVQGGLRILERVEAIGCDTYSRRPRLRAWDVPVLLWRSLWM